LYRALKKEDHRRGMPRYEVMLISNDLPTIRIIKSYFDSKQFKFNIVSSCSKALEELQNQTPLLILLDRILPAENREILLNRIKIDKNLRKVSIKTFAKNEYKLQRTNKRKKKRQIYKGDVLNQKDKNKARQKLIQRLRLIDSIPPPIKSEHLEFKINQYITLKLIYRRTFIYVNHIRFLQCIRLTLNIQKSNAQMYDEINSIDEAADLYAKHLFQNRIVRGAPPLFTDQEHDITPEQEFWGHCSNIQAWVEHDYDTRILKSNISFPLLRKLTEAGDPLAKKVFKKEIALRFEDGYPSVVQYLVNEGYLKFLTPTEIKTIIEITKLIENLVVNRNMFIGFLQFCRKNLPNLVEDIILKLLTLPNGPNILISDILKNSIFDFYRFDRQLLNSVKEALRNLSKQTDLQQREVIEKVIIKIEENISKQEKNRRDQVLRNYPEIPIFKVIVIGDPATGKTELLAKFATNKFEEKYLQTFGVSILKEPVELKDYGIKINLMFWNIAGQPQFYTLHRPYFNGADGILLVFDTSRSSTFSNINNWYSSAVKYGLSGVPRILIGNKVRPEEDRKIILPMAEHLSEKLNAPYFETSVLTGENVNVVFHKIAEMIYLSKEIHK